MNAIDANVIVRFIARDDPQQAAAAIACVRRGVFVTESVLMEAEWVLKSSYGMSRAQINGVLRKLLNTDTVTVRDQADLAWALDRHAAGADLADMLHLVSVRHLATFATFDQRLRRQAGPAAPIAIVSL